MIKRIWLLSIVFCSWSAQAEDVDATWAKNNFKKSDSTFYYVVGVSDQSPSQTDAVNQARAAAVSILIQEKFSQSTSVSIDSVESTKATVVKRKSNVKVQDMDLARFSLTDQVIEDSIPKNTVVYTAKVLYRIRLDDLASEQKRLAATGAPADKPSEDIEKEAAKAQAAHDQRQEDYLKEAQHWSYVFPFCAFDLIGGYNRMSTANLGGVGAALRFRLLQRLYLGLEGHWLLGSIGNQSNSASSYLVMSRVYIVRSARAGVYLKPIGGLESMAPRSGTGTAKQGISYGGGLGLQGLSDTGVGYSLETTYSRNQNFGHSFWVGLTLTIPLFNRTYVPSTS